MKRLLGLLLFLGMSVPAFGQGTVVSPQPALKNTGTSVVAMIGATVTVCAANAYPTGAVSAPCSPALANTLFKDAALTIPQTNPFFADNNGNYTFAIAAGQYTVTVTQFGQGYAYQLTVSCPLGGACTWTGTQTFNNIVINGTCTGSGCGGGSTPGAPNLSLQYNNSSVLTGASGITTPDGNSLSIKGYAPWVDITAYGARTNFAFGYGSSTTASCNGTTAITLASAYDFINGDGADFYGCGPSNTMSTPSAPTVTNVFDAGGTRTHQTVVDSTGGSTNVWYKVVAEDINGALTAPSSATETTTSESSLGAQSATASAASRSNDVETLNVTTHLTQGAVVDVGSTAGTNQEYSGWFQVCSNPGTTITFCATPIDSRSMPTNYNDQTSVSGNISVVWYQGNKIAWPAVTGAFRYYICKSTDGSTYTLVGQSMVQNNSTGFQDLAFEDWGSTYMANQGYPWYVSNAICTGSATNGILATTVVSGAGTTNITVATAASQTISGAKTIHDTAPNILNAIKAANPSISPFAQGIVYIPPTTGNVGYQINSVLQVPQKTTIKQAGWLTFGAPLYLTGSVNWDGNWSNSGTSQFSTSGNAIWNGGGSFSPSNPVAIFQGTGNVIRNLDITTNQNASNDVITDNFNGEMSGITFNSYNASSNDTLGVALTMRDTTQTINDIFLSNVAFLGGPGQVADASWTPLVMTTVPVGFNEEFAVTLDHTNWNRRGMVVVGTGTCALVKSNWSYRQGGIMPMFGFKSCGNTYIAQFDYTYQDTEGEPVIFNMSGNSPPAASGGNFFLNYVTGGATSSLVTGTRPLTFKVQDYSAGVNGNGGNTNRSSQECNSTQYATVASPFESGSGNQAFESICRFMEPVQIASGYSIGANLNPPTSITATGPGSGGSVPNGTYVYAVSSVGFDGGESMAQPIASSSVTTTTGNNTVTVGWTPQIGAVSQNVYRCSTVNVCVQNGVLRSYTSTIWYRVATHVTGTSFSDTVASTSGTQPVAITATTVTGFNSTLGHWGTQYSCPETTAPSGVAAWDILYCDSTAHAMMEIKGTGSASQVATYTDFASPPAIGNTSANSGAFTTLSATGNLTTNVTGGGTQCVHVSNAGVVSGTGSDCGSSGSTGANAQLSNISMVALSASLIPGAVNSEALGSSALPFTNFFFGTVANQSISGNTANLTANRVVNWPDATSTPVRNCPAVTNQFITALAVATGSCSQALVNASAASVPSYVADSGAVNAYVATLSPALVAYAAGLTVRFLPANANTSTTPTLNVNGLGAVTITRYGQAALQTNDLITTAVAEVVYDGTDFELQNPATLSGVATSTSVNTFTNKTLNAESTGNSLSEPARAFFPAAGCNSTTAGNGWDLGVTNAPNPQCVGTNVRKGVLQFARGNVGYINFHLPNDWNASASTDINICFTTTDTGNGHITNFGIQTGFNAVSGAVTDDPTLNVSQPMNVTIGASQTSGGELCGSLTGLTMTGSSANYNFEIAITRNGSGTDTNVDTAVAVKSAELVYGVTKNSSNR